MSCAACDLIHLAEDGRNPDFVAKLAESYVTLADEQAYRGYCIVLLRDHHEHLARLPLDRQLRLYEDVTRVAHAVDRELAPRRVNVACLGNLVTHVHWHVTPRYDDDPEPQHPIWVRPLSERRVALADGERRALVARLRAALGA
jgi:diadenosine tetraphosphate (Ap4A) HIT family hydrolase